MPHGDRKPVTEQPILMYQSAGKVYPRDAHGRYARLRRIAMIALLGLFYLIPWLRIGGAPLVLFDLPARRFHVFGLTLVPQDLYLLSALLLAAALTLFFFTTVAGRLWCGYACPQTVWTEAFLWMERRFEGDRHLRLKLDRGPWNGNKILRKGGKHLAWIAFAFATGLSFVGYFVPVRELVGELLHGTLAGWSLFWVLFYGFATWGNAGFMREQVCKYMCPYARFQSAMFDRDTLIIAYDEKRGEPRKSLYRKLLQQRAPSAAALLAGERREDDDGAATLKAGDCVDCSLCVQVCPVGIDIRKGLQYECIACAACIDACNEVMDQVGKPHGLIRYSSARHDAGGRFRVLRPRAVGYGAVWLLVLAATAWLIVARSPFDLDVVRDRKQLYRELDDGRIENVYALKLSNKQTQQRHYRIAAAFTDGSAVTVEPDALDAGPGEHVSLTVAASAQGQHPSVARLRFVVTADDGSHTTQSRIATFLSDGRAHGDETRDTDDDH
ncbi:cytochrome c oxidase accessory protein CcoG [Solimonas terrae]|uniref:Cytochrome c oxidase accessory protein CcoG n=1 Tax=Solimonas terrae TaxID=1396819 RepID=A0A6M2BMF9_9GAMM|nr:cytochrome c oxidase accessory protein CcoG [Solimonas terrae]NGY03193.1 cytochrome c oxidase accessory protein CcoG [Solimonas terrae]